MSGRISMAASSAAGTSGATPCDTPSGSARPRGDARRLRCRPPPGRASSIMRPSAGTRGRAAPVVQAMTGRSSQSISRLSALAILPARHRPVVHHAAFAAARWCAVAKAPRASGWQHCSRPSGATRQQPVQPAQCQRRDAEARPLVPGGVPARPLPCQRSEARTATWSTPTSRSRCPENRNVIGLPLRRLCELKTTRQRRLRNSDVTKPYAHSTVGRPLQQTPWP